MSGVKGETVAIVGGAAPTELAVLGRYVTLTNRGAGSVYLGGKDLTAANYATNAYELKTGETINVDAAIDPIYAFAVANGSIGILGARRPQSA